MFLEYDWTFDVYRPRFMGTFIEIGGERSFENLEHARLTLLSRGLKIGKKTDSRTWEIEVIPRTQNAMGLTGSYPRGSR